MQPTHSLETGFFNSQTEGRPKRPIPAKSFVLYRLDSLGICGTGSSCLVPCRPVKMYRPEELWLLAAKFLLSSGPAGAKHSPARHGSQSSVMAAIQIDKNQLAIKSAILSANA